MARERAIQIRVSHDEYEAIKTNAGEKPIGEFLRDLGLRETPQPDDPSTRQIKESIRNATPDTEVEITAGTAMPRELTKLIKQLEAQGNPNAEEVARKRLGM